MIYHFKKESYMKKSEVNKALNYFFKLYGFKKTFGIATTKVSFFEVKRDQLVYDVQSEKIEQQRYSQFILCVVYPESILPIFNYGYINEFELNYHKNKFSFKDFDGRVFKKVREDNFFLSLVQAYKVLLFKDNLDKQLPKKKDNNNNGVIKI